MQRLIQDIRYALRLLIKSPGFTITALLTLAIGVGTNTAIFSVINSVLLKAPDFDSPDRLVLVWENRVKQNVHENNVSPADYLDWHDQNRVFEDMSAFNIVSFDLIGDGDPEAVFGMAASASLFPLLGVKPAAGRVFAPDEDRPGNKVALVSSGLWQRRYASDRSLVGRTISLNGESHTVIGVLPPEFNFFLNKVDVWVPLSFKPDERTSRGNHYLRVVARLKPNITKDQAQAEMTSIANRLETQFPDLNAGHGAEVVMLREQFVKNIRPSLLLLLGTVGFVLLIACVNVANLLLARASVRGREVAVRVALGAVRRRLVRQLLTESVLLAVLGGAIAIALAYWGLHVITALIPSDPNSLPVPGLDHVSIDFRVLGFTLLISIVTGVVFGIAPALQTSSANMGEILKEAGKGTASGSTRNMMRNILAVVEIAMALVLLIGAALMVNNFLRLRQTDPGFDPTNVITANVSAPASRYPQQRQQAVFFQQVLQRIQSLPGVESAGAVVFPPLSGLSTSRTFTVEGKPLPPGEEVSAGLNVVSADYFDTMKIPLQQGRVFTDADGFGGKWVALINSAMARRYWVDETPLGKRFKMGAATANNPWVEIVGVVGDVKHSGLDKEVRPEIYLTYVQAARPFITFVARASGSPTALSQAIRGEVWAVDKDVPVAIKSMDQLVSESVSQPKFQTVLLTVFGVVALALAAIGLYGLISYAVTQRTHEIGIRVAFGAQQKDILKLVLRQATTLALIGTGIGLTLALALLKVLPAVLYKSASTDVTTFVGAAAVLIGIVILATYFPARRAARVDPCEALRYQ